MPYAMDSMGLCALGDRAGTRLYSYSSQWVRAREINTEKYCRLQTAVKVMKLRGERKAKPEKYKIYIPAEDSSQRCYRAEQLHHQLQDPNINIIVLPKGVCRLSHFSHVQLLVTLWTVVCQIPMSMGILQARILEWVVMLSSRGSSRPRDRPCVSITSPVVVQRQEGSILDGQD